MAPEQLALRQSFGAPEDAESEDRLFGVGLVFGFDGSVSVAASSALPSGNQFSSGDHARTSVEDDRAMLRSSTQTARGDRVRQPAPVEALLHRCNHQVARTPVGDRMECRFEIAQDLEDFAPALQLKMPVNSGAAARAVARGHTFNGSCTSDTDHT